MSSHTSAFVSSFVPALTFRASTQATSTGSLRRHSSPCASTALANDKGDTSPAPSPLLSRRAFCTTALAVAPLLAATAGGAAPARADGLSSQLTQYRDLPKGFTILRPNGWNEFEGLQDNYDIKWQDVIQPLEFVTVLTSPIAKEKRLSDLGDVETVGARLAASRGGELVKAVEKDIDGTPAYVVEIKREKSHQLTLVTVAKMKLYSVNASCSTSRWSRREKLLRAVVDSFKPKL